ncbi:MAG TPA: DNA repair protein RecO [Xanthobacteraceae bacterium]|nr:DNA repair protein RecO [Xanthobacteraceae bacterium]
MEWTDEGIVLGTRRHGEANAIAEVLTIAHGRHLGLVRGGAGSRLRPVLQPGNSVRVTWRARLDEHLGHYVVEGLNLRAAGFLLEPHALYGLTHLCALGRLLPERDPHPALYGTLLGILESLSDPVEAGVQVARFELLILAELGFGLDLETCAATGSREDLAYVSPRSGRAVSRAAGAPWEGKLLRLPPFLTRDGAPAPSGEELAQAFALTGHFLLHHVFEPRGAALPQERAQFIAALGRRQSRAARISA